jgi:hypothetical protein
MDQALETVRGHIQGRDAERVFVSCRCLGALVLKQPVDLTLYLGQLRLRPRRS